jgi:vesicle coat complex subunit
VVDWRIESLVVGATRQVQLALLTAIVKLFIRRPTAGQDLVPKVLKIATEEVDNPDLRDRVRMETSCTCTPKG